MALAEPRVVSDGRGRSTACSGSCESRPWGSVMKTIRAVAAVSLFVASLGVAVVPAVAAPPATAKASIS